MTVRAAHDGRSPLTLYTAEEAAEVLRVRTSWLERQAAARKVPFTMLGGCYRFTADHLAQIVRIFEAAPTAAVPAASTPISTSRSHRGKPAGTAPGAAPLRPRPRAQQDVA